MKNANGLTHVDQNGVAQMVDISEKAATVRSATAEAWVGMSISTMEAICKGYIAKGNVLAVARVAGIQAAKKTAELIPMCHSLNLTGIEINFAFVDVANQRIIPETSSWSPENLQEQGALMTRDERQLTPLGSPAAIRIEATCKLTGRTGVEMEALTAASITALTIYDMCKALEKSMIIGSTRLLSKTGGKSGDFRHEK